MRGLLVLLIICSCGFGQAPTGNISGTVMDESGAVMPGISVQIRNIATGLERAAQSEQDGSYRAATLPAGDYEVRAAVSGFRTLVRTATVLTGSTTDVELRMQIGSTADVVTVESAGAQISYDSHKVDGVITRQQIESLPLNGRSFLQLAFLEPGVSVATATLAQYNAQFSVTVLGGSNARTAINADGGNIRDRTTGNTSQNISQEVVQEFQLSSVNFDLSTGITSVGSVNIVTRSGGNAYHGAGYFYFRDNNISAYPALRREALNLDPFFARRQSGFWLGGPIKKDRLFFFVNLEHNNQDSVFTVQPDSAPFAPFAQIAPSPYTVNQPSVRLDYRASPKHNLFLRYTHDGNKAYGPNAAPTMPSNWLVNTNWSDQSIMGITSAFRPNLVNDFRFSYNYWKNRNLFPTENECPGCIGLGFPQVVVAGTNFIMGNTQNATQGRDYRTWHWIDTVTWQKGAHQMRFGFDFERDQTAGFWNFCSPACVTVYAPATVSRVAPGIRLPQVFRRAEDVLELPVFGMTVGFGDGRSPAPFQRERSVYNYRFRGFWQDSWRVRPRFTLNYGLAWQAETTLANHDLDKPAYLAPIIGGGDNLLPTRRDYNNFSPSLGFAWGVTNDNKTVVRAGGGIYYDTALLWERLNERNSIGPRGNGRNNVPGGSIPNQVTGIPGVPVGTPLDFQTVPTEFRLKHFLDMLPRVGGIIGPQFQANFSDLSVRGVNVTKSVSGFATIFPRDYPLMYGQHLNAGVQREIRRDMVITADFVLRHFLRDNFGTTLDLNRFQSARGPVIPLCRNAAERNDPAVNCSTGVIQGRVPHSRANYKGLLVKLDKRFTNRYQFTVSYALQDRMGIAALVNKDDWFAGWGPLGARHLLNVSGIVELPKAFRFSFISAVSSKLPVTPSITGIDLDGDGSGFDLLPGVRMNGFNRGLGRADLESAVADFNTRFAGRVTPRNQPIRAITLPSNFRFGDNFFSQDIRLGRVFRFKERYQLNVFGEIFNVLNIANLSGFAYNLYDPSLFGQPTLRTNQIFGSGGPRAFQVGARVSF